MPESIISLIQNYVDKMAPDVVSGDSCPPPFLVSLYGDEILLTISHNGIVLSEKIFPSDFENGLSPIYFSIKNLYNRTM